MRSLFSKLHRTQSLRGEIRWWAQHGVTEKVATAGHGCADLRTWCWMSGFIMHPPPRFTVPWWMRALNATWWTVEAGSSFAFNILFLWFLPGQETPVQVFARVLWTSLGSFTSWLKTLKEVCVWYHGGMFSSWPGNIAYCCHSLYSPGAYTQRCLG